VLSQCSYRMQILHVRLTFAHNEVSSACQEPVNREATSGKTLVGIICSAVAVTPVLDVELLALSKRTKRQDGGNDKLEGNHIVPIRYIFAMKEKRAYRRDLGIYIRDS
jgi:hypothetical protein